MDRAFLLVAPWLFVTVSGAITKIPHHGDMVTPTFSSSLIVDTKIPRPLDGQSSRLWERAVYRISLGDISAAEADFLNLLRLTPDFYPVMDTPPKIMTPFLRARQHFLSEHNTREKFKAAVVEERAQGSLISIIIQAEAAFLSLVTEITVHVKTRSQSAFRSINFSAPVFEQGKLSLQFSYPMTTQDHLEYYLDFVGHFGEPFFTVGSPAMPRFLAVTDATPLADRNVKPTSSLAQIKAGWPVFLGVALTIAGALTYGLLKLDR